MNRYGAALNRIDRTVVMALLILGLVPVLVWGQVQPPSLLSWDIQIWPEYDQPSVLVINRYQLPGDVSFPVTVDVPVPADVAIHAVAFEDETGALLQLDWRSEPAEDGQVVSFELDRPAFVVEYYADVIAPPPDRRFELDLAAPYDTEAVTIGLLMPDRASDLSVTPAMDPAGLDGRGNQRYAATIGAMSAGQAVTVQVGYTKADAEPSTAAPAPVGQTIPATADEGEGALPAWVGWVLAIMIGVAVIAAALFAYRRWQQRQTGRLSRQARRRQARARQETQPAAARSQSARTLPPATSNAARDRRQDRFCPQCGEPFAADDRFCRACGTPRRTS